MNTHKSILVLFLFILTIFFDSIVYSQLDNTQFPNKVCGMNPQIPLTDTYQYPFFPMNNDTLHTLVVFCNFPSPSGDFDIPNTCLLQYWPGNNAQTMPSWADDVICPNTNNIWNPSLTGYFRDASMGRFYLTGDVYPDLYVFQNQVSYYASSDKKIGYAVKELLLYIDETGNIDWYKYDKFDPFDLDNDNNRREPDGIVDFIFIVFRFTNAHTIDPPSYTGIACLGGQGFSFGTGVSEITTQDGHRILAGFPGSGCIGGVTNPWEIGVLSHEFAEHYGYGYGHSEVMGCYNINGGGIASAYDREHFGWNTTNAITPTTNTMGIELEDYVTTNDYIKIQRQNEILYLENRKRTSYYSSVNNIIWKWNCDDPVRPGQSDSMLLIYRNTGSRTFDIQSAFGNFDWQMCSGYRYKTIWNTSRNNYFFTQSPNRWGGQSTFGLHGCVSDANCNDVACQTGYWGAGGDFNTCFDVGYNDVISPWSNPPLIVANQYDSLTIEINGRNQYGNLLINVYFTNITDARPSKPQGLQVIMTECENNLQFPKLTWEHNLEPDMLRPDGNNYTKRYRIYRAYGVGAYPPGYYTEIATQDFNSNVAPVFVDYNASTECGTPEEPPLVYSVFYRVQAIDNTDLESSLSDSVDTRTQYINQQDHKKPLVNSNSPKSFALNQNYPNPFNPKTRIEYSIAKPGITKLEVFDMLGRLVKVLENTYKEAGEYIVEFDGSNLSSGIYVYRLQSNNFIESKRMVLIK